MIIIQIAGRLGKDAETRFTPSGQKVTTLTVATNVRKSGKEETVWWRVTIWGERFDKMLPYFKKGTALFIVGEMGKPEIWTDKEGRPQVSMDLTADIIKFSPFGSPERNGQDSASSNNAQTNQTSQGNESRTDFGASQQPYKAYSDNGFQGMQTGQNPSNSYSNHADSEDSLPF
jgi:single-strand DNA-binding protein